MPRWARFLSCGFTTLVLTLTGFLLSAYWFERIEGYWQHLTDFAATPAFWNLVSLLALQCTVILLAARIGVNLYGLASGLAGFLAGGLVAAIYALFLISSHLRDWGGLSAVFSKLLPAAAVFVLPFALAGAFTSWLWDRLE